MKTILVEVDDHSVYYADDSEIVEYAMMEAVNREKRAFVLNGFLYALHCGTGWVVVGRVKTQAEDEWTGAPSANQD